MKINHRTEASTGLSPFASCMRFATGQRAISAKLAVEREETVMLQTVSPLLPELALLFMTAAATHLVMSFAQTLMHYKLGHHPMGGKFFRNHINFHHRYYSQDRLVSRTYLGDEGNNTPFFFIPVFLLGACTYLEDWRELADLPKCSEKQPKIAGVSEVNSAASDSPERAEFGVNHCSLMLFWPRPRGGKMPHGQCGRGWFPMGGRGEGQDRRLAFEAGRHRRALPGWT